MQEDNTMVLKLMYYIFMALQDFMSQNWDHIAMDYKKLAQSTIILLLFFLVVVFLKHFATIVFSETPYTTSDQPLVGFTDISPIFT